MIVRCLWTTDPLLLWERYHGQRIKIAIRKNPSYDEEGVEEAEEVDDLEEAFLYLEYDGDDDY